MRVVLNYNRSADAAAEAVLAAGGPSQAIAVQADVSNPDDVNMMVRAAMDAFGRVDVLVNNAGAIVRPADWREISPQDWQRTIDVNLTSAFNCIKTVAPIMLSRRTGVIVNIASTYGMTGAAAAIAYVSAKAGLTALTRSFAKELAPHVTVNAVAPGNIDTGMTRGAGNDFIRATIDATPLKRLGRPEDIAGVVAFLASPDGAFITGQVVVVDGGHMLR